MKRRTFYEKWIKWNGLEYSPLKRKTSPVPGEEWDALQNEVARCRDCLYASERLHTVFGEGGTAARLVFVGEGPGREEDESGRPFVGRAGRLLRKVLEETGADPSHLYIANIVKCRPFNNENPREEAVKACLPYLEKQLEILSPRLIVALGKVPGTILSGEKDIRITKEHGRMTSHGDFPLLLTFHPSFLIRPNGASFIPAFKADIIKALEYIR
jgi:DNA polymerase